MHFSPLFLTVVLTILCASFSVLAGELDGVVTEAILLVDGGPGADVPTIAFVSEGYTPFEMPVFAEQVDLFVTALLASEPYATCHPVNIWRIGVTSNESGTDDPAGCPGGLGRLVNTYFDSSLCGNGLDRHALEFDRVLASDVLDAAVPDWDQGIILVNSETLGGADGVPLAATTAEGWIEDLVTALLPENQPPVCDAGGAYEAECAGLETPVTLSAAASNDPDCDALTYAWTGPFSEGIASGEIVTVSFSGLGTFPVQLDVSDGDVTTTCMTTVTIVDTTPPDLSVMVEPNTLWPPNHKHWEIAADLLVQDGCDEEVLVRLVSVTSSELENGKGDGHTQEDVAEADFGTDDRLFKLRAERSGRGKGRVYAIRYEAEDASGNLSEVEAFVVVPKSQGVNGFPCLPEAPEPVLPDQEDAHDRLHYQWEAEPCATWYELWINRDQQLWHHRWYRKGHGVGFIHERLDHHAPGRYDWWVRAWGPAGMGRWATGPSFTLDHASGRDSFGADNVVLSGLDSGSGGPSWFQFWVYRDGKPFWKTWAPAEEVLFEGDDWVYGVPYTFPLGQYAWWYRTWGREAGTSRWAEGMPFDIGRLQVQLPGGSIQGRGVTVVWDDLWNAQAAWYQLWLGQDGDQVWGGWLPATETATEGSEHAAVLPVELSAGPYTVFVRGWGDRAFGPWSAGCDFEVGTE